tara:strand:- start:263 stop:478 length:216 start_codon:yes stop_codon:yes gene_type:complete
MVLYRDLRDLIISDLMQVHVFRGEQSEVSERNYRTPLKVIDTCFAGCRTKTPSGFINTQRDHNIRPPGRNF